MQTSFSSIYFTSLDEFVVHFISSVDLDRAMFSTATAFIALLIGTASCELFSATEELRALTVHHETFVSELRLLIKELQNDLAYTTW